MQNNKALLEMYEKKFGNYLANHRDFYANPSISRMEPFKIADNLYYVGDERVCIHLIDTGDGLVLLDSGYFGATHLLVDSIWRAGFDPKNVRWIIHTHGHYDHYGSSEEIRNMYGTKLAISKVDAEALRNLPKRSCIVEKSFPYAKTPVFDYEIEDGEIFELGDVKIRCVLTPGHTVGVISLFFNVTDNGKTYLAGLFGGAGTSALTLPFICFNEYSEDMPQQMLNSIDKVFNEPVEVHLGNHPSNNNTIQKRQRQLKEGGNPFIASDSWKEFLQKLKLSVEKIILDNENLKKELS